MIVDDDHQTVLRRLHAGSHEPARQLTYLLDNWYDDPVFPPEAASQLHAELGRLEAAYRMHRTETLLRDRGVRAQDPEVRASIVAPWLDADPDLCVVARLRAWVGGAQTGIRGVSD